MLSSLEPTTAKPWDADVVFVSASADAVTILIPECPELSSRVTCLFSALHGNEYCDVDERRMCDDSIPASCTSRTWDALAFSIVGHTPPPKVPASPARNDVNSFCVESSRLLDGWVVNGIVDGGMHGLSSISSSGGFFKVPGDDRCRNLLTMTGWPVDGALGNRVFVTGNCTYIIINTNNVIVT